MFTGENMNLIKIDDDTWVEVEGTAAKVYKKSILQSQLSEAEEQLSERPELETDQILAWAMTQKIVTDLIEERASLQKKIDSLNETLAELV